MFNDQKVCNAIGKYPSPIRLPTPLKTKHNFFGRKHEIYALVSAHSTHSPNGCSVSIKMRRNLKIDAPWWGTLKSAICY